MSEVVNLLRLAWQADSAGRAGMRDALLTLVVAEGAGEHAALAERSRRLLLAHRPEHIFGSTSSVAETLSSPRVRDTLAKLQLMYPAPRVKHLLLKGEALRGPYRGPGRTAAQVLDDLAVAPNAQRVRRVDEGAKAAPGPHAPAGVDAPAAAPNADPDGKLAIFYVSVLLALAILLENVIRPAKVGETRAA